MEESEKLHIKSERMLMIVMGVSHIINFASLAIVVLVGVDMLAKDPSKMRPVADELV